MVNRIPRSLLLNPKQMISLKEAMKKNEKAGELPIQFDNDVFKGNKKVKITANKNQVINTNKTKVFLTVNEIE